MVLRPYKLEIGACFTKTRSITPYSSLIIKAHILVILEIKQCLAANFRPLKLIYNEL